MGREIRRVPQNWEHPINDSGQYVAMYNESYADACAEWRKGYEDWERAGRLEYRNRTGHDLEYWDYGSNPPEKDMYPPWKAEEATWYQLFETVSEGTPVSPPFATLQELSAYLAEYGDWWDQHRCAGGWGKRAAERFCEVGYAPTAVIQGGNYIEGKLMYGEVS